MEISSFYLSYAWIRNLLQIHCLTVFDCFILPFAVIAFLTPTRTCIALNILRRAWASKEGKYRENETDQYETVRYDFFVAGLSAPLDLVGIAAAFVCAILPWPTGIFRLMTLDWEETGDNDVSAKVVNMNRHSIAALYCIVTSLGEMPFAIASLAIGLVTPTRTMATLRVFGNHLYYRASPNVYWMGLFGCNHRANASTEKPVLFLDSLHLIFGAVLDWITAPALVVVLVGGAARLPKMFALGRAALYKSKSSSISQSGAKNHLPSPWSAKPWPCRIDVTTAEPHGGGNGKGFGAVLL